MNYFHSQEKPTKAIFILVVAIVLPSCVVCGQTEARAWPWGHVLGSRAG